MEEKLDFSLPEKKQGSFLTAKITILLLLILVFLALANLFIKSSGQVPPVKSDVSSLSSEQTRQLAAKLAQRNLYVRAARVWQDYLSGSKLPDIERAKTLFQIGTLLEKAGMYAEAVEYYYRSEITAKLDELEPQINTHIKNCFESLGKFSALRYELMDRTSFKKSDEAGGRIVAEIGAEKITEADLDALIEKTIDNELAPMKAFMTAEQLNEQKGKILEQYKSPAAKRDFLQSWLTQEVLYRQALEEKLSEQPQTKSVIEDLVRVALSRQLMNNELAGRVNITETDLQTYYQANKTKYVQPPNEDDPNSVERQQSFEEVRDRIISELIGRKSQDIQQQYIKQMMDKYNVIIHMSALAPTDPNENNE